MTSPSTFCRLINTPLPFSVYFTSASLNSLKMCRCSSLLRPSDCLIRSCLLSMVHSQGILSACLLRLYDVLCSQGLM